MESSGIAEATWQHGKGYFVVRGISDFANDGKNKIFKGVTTPEEVVKISQVEGVLVE